MTAILLACSLGWCNAALSEPITPDVCIVLREKVVSLGQEAICRIQ